MKKSIIVLALSILAFGANGRGGGGGGHGGGSSSHVGGGGHGSSSSHSSSHSSESSHTSSHSSESTSPAAPAKPTPVVNHWYNYHYWFHGGGYTGSTPAQSSSQASNPTPAKKQGK